MALRLSKHERDRVKKGISGIRSFDIVDFPELHKLEAGDMLIWDPSGQDGLGFWATSSQLFGKDISRNLTLIKDNSNNIGLLDVKIDDTALQIKNEIIGLAPETMDTLAEIAEVMGNPDNIAGSIINKITLLDNVVNNHSNKDTVHDVSINLLEVQVAQNFTDISQNRIDIVTNNATHANQLNLTDIQVNTNSNNIGANTNSVNTININVDQFKLDISENRQYIFDMSRNLFDPNVGQAHGARILKNEEHLGRVDISLNDTRINNLSRISDICNNLIRIVSNDQDIGILQNKVDTAETDIIELKTNVNINSSNIAGNDDDILDLQTRMSSAETNVTNSINNIASNDIDINTNQTNISTLQNTTSNHTTRLNTVDISINQIETGQILNIPGNITKINTNIANIETNLTTTVTNATNIQTNETNILTQTQRLDTLMNGAGTALDTIKEIADVIGDPNGIGSSVITKIGNLDASMNEIFNEKNQNDQDIATNVQNINANVVAINTKQPLITENDLQISYVSGLQNAINQKQDAIEEEGLPQSKVAGLAVSLNSKQNVIPDGGLSIAKTANLQDKLNAKQNVIGEESLAQTKIFNLVASLASKQDNIGNGDLAINHTQGLQVALDNKQNVIQNNDLSLSQVNGLENELAAKQLALVAGSKITISDTQTIDTVAAVKLDELNDVKMGGTGILKNDIEFENSLLIGTVETGSLSQAVNNIGIGNLALSSLSAGRNNIAIGVDSLKNLKNKEYNVGVGTDTLRHVVGDGNTAVGYKAGALNLIAGENNTLMGRSADIVLGNTSITNATAIGYNSRVGASNQIQLGNSLVNNVKTYGTMTLGEVTYPKLDGIAGQFLRTDGNGNATFTGIQDFEDILNRLDASMNDTVPAQLANTSQVEINRQAITALTNIDTGTLSSIETLNTALNEDYNFANTVLGLVNDRMSKNGNIVENVTGKKTFVDGIVIPEGQHLTGNSTTTTQFKTKRYINEHLYDGTSDISLNVVDMVDVTNAGSGKIITDAERLRNEKIEEYAEQAAQTFANVEAAGGMMVDKNESIIGVKTFVNGISIPGGQQLTGNSSTATKFKTSRKINGHTFDGTADIAINGIDLPDVASIGSGQIITIQERDDINSNKSRLNTLLNNANGVLDTVLEIQQAIKTDPQFFQTMENSLSTKVNKDGNIDEIITGIKTFAALLKAPNGIEANVTGDLTGNASTATKFETQRYINGHLFDGTTNASLQVTDLTDVTDAGSGIIITDAEREIITDINNVIATRIDSQHISNQGALMRTGNHTVSGEVTFTNPVIGDLSGNAATSEILRVPRYIAGQRFDGSNDIDFSVLNTTDVTDVGSGKIITDIERTTLNVTYLNRLDQIDVNINQNLAAINNQNNSISNVDGNTVKISNTNQTINGNKTFTNDIIGNITGNSNSATQLQNGRTIAGKFFDGRNDITIAAENLSNITDSGSGKIITDAERSNYNDIFGDGVRKSDVNQTISGIKTFSNAIVGDLNGNAATATTLSPGCFVNGTLLTGGVNINLSAKDLSDIDDAHEHSGKIITDSERETLLYTRNTTDDNTFAIRDLSMNLDLIIRDSEGILATLSAINDSTDFVLDVTNKVEDISNAHIDLSGNYYTFKASQETKHDALETSHNTLSGNHTTLQTSHTTLSGNHDTLQTSHNTLTGNHNTLKADFDLLKTDHDALKIDHTTLSGNHDTLQTSHTTLSGNHDTLQTSHTTLSGNHNTLQTNFNDISSNYYSYKSNHTADFNLLSGNHDNLKIAHDALQVSHNTLSDNHDTLQGLHDTLSTGHDNLVPRVTIIENGFESNEVLVSAINNKYSDLSANFYGDFTVEGNKTFTKTIIANDGISIDDKKYKSGDKINYPTVVTATTYQSTDVQTNNDLATILSTLSTNIANLSSALQALNNKTVLNESVEVVGGGP